MDINTLNYVNKFYDRVKTTIENGNGAKIGNKVVVFQNNKYFVINEDQQEVLVKDGFDTLIDAIIHAIEIAAEEYKRKKIRKWSPSYVKLRILTLIYGKERFLDLEEVGEALLLKKKQLDFKSIYK